MDLGVTGAARWYHHGALSVVTKVRLGVAVALAATGSSRVCAPARGGADVSEPTSRALDGRCDVTQVGGDGTDVDICIPEGEMTTTSTQDNEGGGATGEGGTPDAGVRPSAVKPQPIAEVPAGDDPAAAGGGTSGDPTTGQSSDDPSGGSTEDPTGQTGRAFTTKSALARAMVFGGLAVFSVLGILIFSGRASWCNSPAALREEIYSQNVASACSSVTDAHTASIFGAIAFGVAFLAFTAMAMNASDK